MEGNGGPSPTNVARNQGKKSSFFDTYARWQNNKKSASIFLNRLTNENVVPAEQRK